MAKTRKSSDLITYKKLSPNCNKPRNNVIKRLTPHCVAGNLSIEATLGLSKFINYDGINGSSVNYAIGSDGRIGLGVEETNRAWTTSSPINDHQAITFEIANNGGAPNWPMSCEAIESWIKLAVDIIKYYGYKRAMYNSKPESIAIGNNATEEWIKTLNAPEDAMLITLHRWYSNKACPGQWFVEQLPSLVDEINKRLGADTEPEKQKKSVTETQKNNTEYLIKVYVSALNIRSGPGTNYPVVKTLTNDKNTYTIIEEKNGIALDGTTIKWGKLKSGIGWIALMYTKKV